MNKTLIVVFAVLANACASAPEPAPPVVAAAVSTIAEPSPAPAPAPVAVAVAENKTPAPFEQSVWKLKKGKMLGGQPAPKVLSTFKNQKTPGTTTEKCYHYQKFSVVEMKSTDEIGSAEVTVRTPTEEAKNLCAKEFKGVRKELKIIEGHFAGVIGDFILLDGEDATEGTLEFQIFDLSGKQMFKSFRHPEEEFTIIAKEGKVSITFFAKVKVSCDLVADGDSCWKKIVDENKLPKTPKPDCKSVKEDALVTVKAHISDLSNPKIKFLGGKATCAPAP